MTDQTTSSETDRFSEEDVGRRVYEPTFAQSHNKADHLIRPVSARTYQQLLTASEDLYIHSNGLFDDESDKTIVADGEQTYYDRRRSVRLRTGYAASLTQAPSYSIESRPPQQNAVKESQPSGERPLTEIAVDASSTVISLQPDATLQQRTAFLTTVGNRRRLLHCYIVRDRSQSKIFPRYFMYLDQGGVFLLSARRRRKSRCSNYLISLVEEDLSRTSPNYFGKVRSNFIGTRFTIYDNGERPESVDKSKQQKIRTELASVHYEHNVLGTRGPRRMTIRIPQTQDNSAGQSDSSGDIILVNKAPRWNDKLNAYCLNFKGRVTEASVKNFQAVCGDDPDEVVMQFGKVGRDRFNVDYAWPVTALQAFGICLTSFDSKLACE